MKSKVKVLWFFTILAVMGVLFSACEEPKDSRSIKIIGIAQVGEILTVDTSKLSGIGEISQYAWYDNNHEILAFTNFYMVQAADVGLKIRVNVSLNHFDGSGTSDNISYTSVVTDYTHGLSYALINNDTAYSVSKGTATASYIIIPSVYNGLPVAEIADSGFSSYENLTDIIIPNGVTRIGNYAFFNCGNLTSVTISAGITNIGNVAFQDCNNLTSVLYAGVNVTAWNMISIGSGNTSLINAKILFYSETHPGTANNHWRFGGVLPEIWGTYGLEFVNSGYRSSLTVSKGTATDAEIIIPSLYEGKPVVFIGDFSNSNLSSVVIPKSIIGVNRGGGHYNSYILNSFSNTDLEYITVINGNPVYRSEGNCVIDMRNNALVIGCKNSVIPNNVTSIGDSAFYGCEGLTSITIPNSVTSIGSGAFSGCTGLTSITIPNSVTSIGRSAFYGTPMWFNTFNNVVYVDKWVVGYRGNINSDLIFNIGTIGIGSGAFSDCTDLTSVTIPNSVTSIGDSAFWRCTNLTSVTIGNSVTSIGNRAFSDCTGLVSVTIGNSVTSIGNRAFSDCTGLTSITIPNSVMSIGSGAFNGCTSLTSVTFDGFSIIERSSSFPGDFGYKYRGAGTYTTTNPGDNAVWVKQ